MKKALSILVLFISFSVFSQQDSIVTVEINASNLTEALNQIEKQTDFTFFYQKKWLTTHAIVVNKKFEKTTIAEILKFVFKDTNLNFYLRNNQIILTENNVIYDKVATYFIEKDEVITTNIKPILIQETQKSITNTDNNNDLIVVGGSSSKLSQSNLDSEISMYAGTVTKSSASAP